MEPSSQHTRKNKRFNFKTVKKVAKVGSLIMVVSFTISVVVSIYTNNIIGKIIQELIKMRTDGTYSIQYEELDYSFTENILKVKNLELKIDTTHENFIGIIHTGGDIAFSAQAPYMYMEISDIWSIYFDRELKINGVRFDDPVLNINSYKEDEGIVWQKDAGSLYDIISDHLEVFRINRMEVKNGKFRFEKRNGTNRKYSIENVSFSIKNFLLDSASAKNKKKFFYTDDIDIEMSDQRFYLKDSVHTMFFKKLVLSTTQSEIFVDSLVVSENKRTRSDRSRQDFYSMYVPSFHIKNIDFKNAYNEGVLNIGRLTINYPKIDISDFPKEYSHRDSTKSTLAALVLDYFSNIEVDSFSLKRASLGYQFKTATRSTGFTLDSLDVELTQFKLDSTNLSSQRPIYYENLEFNVKDYQFNLPDSIHIFSFTNLIGSTRQHHLTFENLRIRPRSDAEIKKLLAKNKKNKTIDLYFPKAVLHNVGGQDFFNSDTLKIEEVEAENAVIELKEYPGFSAKKDYSDSLIFNFFPLLDGFAKAIYIQKGRFSDGDFTWLLQQEKLTPKYMIQNFDLNFNGVAVDSQAARRLFSAESFEIFSEKVILEGPEDPFIFYADNLFYSGESNRLDADNVELRLLNPKDGGEPDRLNIHNVQCRGIDLNHIFVDGKNNISYLKVTNPEIQINRTGERKKQEKKTLLSPEFEYLNVNQFIIENGNFDVNLPKNRHFEAKNVFFAFDRFKSKKYSQKKFSLDNYQLRLSNLLFSDSANNVFSIERVNYTPEDSTTILKNLRYRSSVQGKPKDFQHVNVPEAIISNWKPLNLYFRNEISPSSIQLNRPDFILVEGNEDDGEKKKIARIGEFIDKIEADKLVIDDGKINYRKARKDDSLFYRTEKVDLTLYHFVIDSTSEEDIFRLENIETDLSNNLITFQKSKDTLFIKNIRKRETGNSFELEDLVYSSFDSKNGHSLVESRIHKTEIQGFDFEKLNDKNIEIDGIHILKPAISYNDRLSSGNSTLEDLIFLSPLNLKGAGFNKIKINTISLDSGRLDLLLKKAQYTKPIFFNELGLRILGFDSEKKSKILNADDVKISFEGITYDFADSLNYIKTGRITLSLVDSSLIVDGFSYIPKIEKYAYGPAKGTQTDWLNINATRLKLNHMDYEKFLTREGIVARKFEIDGLDIYAFRDKRIPIKEEIYKPLPQELLRRVPMLIHIDTTVLQNGKIRYEEFAVEANKPGIVEFTNLNATAYNICNDSLGLQKNPRSFINAEALMMDQSKLSATFRFDLVSPENYFNLDATLESMELEHFNCIMEPIAFVTIKKGKNNKMNLTALANEEVAVGSMYFDYEDLKISFINKNTYDTKGMGPVISSIFANTFIIKKNNPRLLLMREGEIYFERDTTKSIFNYWAKIFFSGIVSSIGAKSNKKEIKKYERMDDEIRIKE